MPTLNTVKQHASKHPAFTAPAIRMLIFNEKKNGLADAGAIVRIGRRVLIDENRWFSWIESQNSGAAS